MEGCLLVNAPCGILVLTILHIMSWAAKLHRPGMSHLRYILDIFLAAGWESCEYKD